MTDFYLMGRRYFLKYTSNEDFVEILEACICDLKRSLLSSFDTVSLQVNGKEVALNNHYSGVFFNILKKAYEGTLEATAFAGSRFQRYVRVTISYNGDLDSVRFILPQDCAYNDEGPRPIELFNFAMEEIDTENCIASVEPKSPYLRFKQANSQIYEQLIFENL
jgi:hypothetical protein